MTDSVFNCGYDCGVYRYLPSPSLFYKILVFKDFRKMVRTLRRRGQIPVPENQSKPPLAGCKRLKTQNDDLEKKKASLTKSKKSKTQNNNSKKKQSCLSEPKKIETPKNKSKIEKLEKEIKQLKQENARLTLKAQLADSADAVSEDDVADDDIKEDDAVDDDLEEGDSTDDDINLCRFNGNDKKVVRLVENFDLYISPADKSALVNSKVKDAALLRELLPSIFYEKVLAKYSAKGARKARKKLPFHIFAGLRAFYFEIAGKQEWTNAEEQIFTFNLNVVLNKIRNNLK